MATENFLEDLNFDKSSGDDKGNDGKSILDDLNDDKDDKDDKKELDLTNDIIEEDKDDDDDDEDEEKLDDEDKDVDDEDDEKEIDLEDEDDLELAKIPKRQEIKAKYPKIFKEFPALDHIIGRERAFAEVFPTVNEAKVARERLNEFAAFESDLLGGKLEPILRSVKKTDEAAYEKIVDSYIETLAKIDPAANLRVATKVTKSVFKYLSDSVKGKEDENSKQLTIAVKLLNNAIFGSFEVTGPEISKVEEKQDPEKTELSKERQEFNQEKFTSAFTEVSTTINSLLEKAVVKELDSKGELPGYIKKTLVKDILSSLNSQLNSDKRFKAIIDRLWIQAKDNKYSTESKNKILTALRNQAKSELLPIIRSKRAEATKGLNLGLRKDNNSQNRDSQNKDRRDKREIPKDKGNNKNNSERLTNNRRNDDSKDMKDGESVMSFIMRD